MNGSRFLLISGTFILLRLFTKLKRRMCFRKSSMDTVMRNRSHCCRQGTTTFMILIITKAHRSRRSCWLLQVQLTRTDKRERCDEWRPQLQQPGRHQYASAPPLQSYTRTTIIIVIVLAMFTALSSWHCHCESSPGSSDECSPQCQVAADLWTKPISLSQYIRL